MSQKMVDEQIELRSEEFNEILGDVPPWILRWGITIVTFVVIILVIGSAFFKYPDTISSTMTLTGTNPVTGIVAKTSGKLKHLYIKDNQQVTKGEYLAIIENPANVKDILRLKEYLRLHANQSDTTHLIPPQEMKLGEIQSTYASFYLAISEYKQFMKQDYHLKKTLFIKDKIDQNKSQYETLLRQQELVKQQYLITEARYKKDSALMVKGSISQKELESSLSQLLQSKISVESTNSSVENLLSQFGQLNENLFEVEYQYMDKKNNLQLQQETQYSKLITELESWEMTYALTSPITGKITFTEYWVENQNIIAGDVVFNIVPANEGEIIGKALLPTERSGKVKTGQKVNIRFINYPDNEYGIVRGYVKNISLIPTINEKEGKRTYTIDIQLPEGLKTTYNKELPFLPEMEGIADIITDDISLLKRFLLPLRKVITESL